MKISKSAVIFAACLFASNLFSLFGQSQPEGDVKIVTNPDESIIKMKGEYRLAGRTPFVVVHELKGFYEITARKTGYEDYKASYFFKPGVRKKLAIKLTKKSREKAFLRSFVAPGWGQVYSDQKWKGVLLAGLQLGSLGYLAYTELDYRDAKDEYTVAFNQFAASGGQDANFYNEVNAKWSVLETKYDRRFIASLLTLSVYMYNLIDSIVFYPQYKYPKLQASVGLLPDGQQPTLALGVRANF